MANQRIFITGGASGLGRAMALRFARAGWNVCIGLRIDPPVWYLFRRTAKPAAAIATSTVAAAAGGIGVRVR